MQYIHHEDGAPAADMALYGGKVLYIHIYILIYI